MYLKYKSLSDLLARQDLSVRRKRAALRRLNFDAFAHEYLRRMNMMKIASSANETVKGTQVDFRTFLVLVRKYRQHRRLLRNERIRKENDAFAAMMEKKSAEVGRNDAEQAAKRQPYGVMKKFIAMFRRSDKRAA